MSPKGIFVQYRFLVVDVDGTLVGADSQPAAGAKAALTAAVAAGLQVGLSTGRTPAACAHLLDALPLTGPHIFFDGSLVLDPRTERPLLAHRVEPTAVSRVLAFAQEHRLAVELYTHTGYFVGALTPVIEAHAALQGQRPIVTDLAPILASGEVIKAELILGPEDDQAVVRHFESRLDGHLRFSWATAPGHPELSFINVVAPGVSKGAALAAVARHLDLPLTAVMAVGDSANDLPMFQVAGLGIAMGNASSIVKAAAHAVTGPVEAGGLAEAIETFIIQPLSNGAITGPAAAPQP